MRRAHRQKIVRNKNPRFRNKMSENQHVRVIHELEHGFKGVVIDILVYIESREDIERVTEVNLPRNNHVTSENWEEVCGTDYSVHMNDRHDPIHVAIEIRFHDPHAVVRVRVVKGFAEAMDKRT